MKDTQKVRSVRFKRLNQTVGCSRPRGYSRGLLGGAVKYNDIICSLHIVLIVLLHTTGTNDLLPVDFLKFFMYLFHLNQVTNINITKRNTQCLME